MGVEGLSVVLLSWKDHHLLGFKLTGTQEPLQGEELTKMVHPRRLMELNGLRTTPGEFPVTLARDLVEALVDLWNGERARDH